MTYKKTAWWMAGLALLVAGCVGPAHVAGPAEGKVASAATKRPVANASVVIEGYPQTTTRTRADGTFSIPAYREWVVYALIFPVDRIPATRVTVAAEGFEARTVEKWEYRGRTIFLKRAPRDS